MGGTRASPSAPSPFSIVSSFPVLFLLPLFLVLSSSLAAASPSNPVQVGYVTNSTSLSSVRSVFVSGDYAYAVSFSSDSLTVFNVSVPSSPMQVAFIQNTTSLNAPYGASSVFVSGGYAYVASFLGSSLTVFNVSNPSSPAQD